MRGLFTVIALCYWAVFGCFGADVQEIVLPQGAVPTSIKISQPVWPSSIIDIPVRIENHGAEDMDISSFMSGCRCSALAGGSGRVPTNTSIDGVIRIHSSAWHGTIGVTLNVQYSVGTSTARMLKIPVTVEVSDLLALSEDVTGVFRISDYDQGSPDSSRTFVIVRGGHPQSYAAVDLAVDPRSALSYAVKAIDEQSWKVTVNGLDRLPIGSVAVPLRFRFRTADGTLLERVVERRMCLLVHGDIKSVPREVLFGEMEADSNPHEATVLFKSSTGDGMVSIKDWIDDHPSLMRIERLAENQAVLHLHDVDTIAEANDIMIRGNCLFTVVHGDRTETINVPYAGMIRHRSVPPSSSPSPISPP